MKSDTILTVREIIEFMKHEKELQFIAQWEDIPLDSSVGYILADMIRKIRMN